LDGASPYRVACGFEARVAELSGESERVAVGGGLGVEAAEMVADVRDADLV
jgi:hypothetical protein